MRCTYKTIGQNKHRCINCGDVRRTAFPPEKIYRDCRRKGFGDRVELCLKWIGITQQRYVEWKGKLGGSNCTDCERRKQWLNGIAWLNNVTDGRWWVAKLRPVVRVVMKPLRYLP